MKRILTPTFLLFFIGQKQWRMRVKTHVSMRENVVSKIVKK